jgi:7-cyano-7-deazaguanine reductase
MGAAKKVKIPANPETQGLSKLGGPSVYRFESPGAEMLEAFANRYRERDYIITFVTSEFTSLCPMTGQPDFATITVRYVADKLCLESKSFKLYMAAYRGHGSFMESITNKIADDLIALLSPRRLWVEGRFNVRGGSAITIQVDYLNPKLKPERKKALASLWPARGEGQ